MWDWLCCLFLGVFRIIVLFEYGKYSLIILVLRSGTSDLLQRPRTDLAGHAGLCSQVCHTHTYLLFGKMVLTQLLPQLPVLAEHIQGGRHLAQGDNVPPI